MPEMRFTDKEKDFMKFIHIADVHLGAKPDKDKPWGKDREQHSWQAFADVITKAGEEQVQLLLIAGDLFHRHPLLRDLKEVNYQFSRIPQTQVVMIAGEHEYLSDYSYYGAFPWGENVHFLKEEKVDYVELEGLCTRVYGLSYHHRNVYENPFQGMRLKKDDYCNILLAHGGDEEHMPFQVNELERMAFDYVALGHLHKPMQITGHKAVMAGALQPVEAGDMGEHGYFMGELEKGACSVTFCPIRYCEYVSMNLKVREETTGEALQDVLAEQIRKAPSHQLFRLVLTGSGNQDNSIDTEALEHMERVVQVMDRCRPDYDFRQLKQRYKEQIPGRYIETLEELPQDEITRKALYYGVEALLAE